MRNRVVAFVACLILTLPSLALASQQVTLKEVISGGKYPKSMAIKDLPEEFKPVRIITNGLAPGADYVSLMFMSTANRVEEGFVSFALDLDSLLWTAGEEVLINGKSYVVGYQTRVLAETGRYNLNALIDSSLFSALGSRGDESRKKKYLPGAFESQLKLIQVEAIYSLSLETRLDRAMVTAWIDENVGGKPDSAPAEDVVTNNLKQVALGTILYSSDYDDHYPGTESTRDMARVLAPYLKNFELFRSTNPDGGSILFNTALAGLPTTTIDRPSATILLYDSRPWRTTSGPKRPLAFSDGSVRWLEEADFQRLFAETRRNYGKRARKVIRIPNKQPGAMDAGELPDWLGRP